MVLAARLLLLLMVSVLVSLSAVEGFFLFPGPIIFPKSKEEATTTAAPTTAAPTTAAPTTAAPTTAAKPKHKPKHHGGYQQIFIPVPYGYGGHSYETMPPPPTTTAKPHTYPPYKAQQGYLIPIQAASYGGYESEESEETTEAPTTTTTTTKKPKPKPKPSYHHPAPYVPIIQPFPFFGAPYPKYHHSYPKGPPPPVYSYTPPPGYKEEPSFMEMEVENRESPPATPASMKPLTPNPGKPYRPTFDEYYRVPSGDGAYPDQFQPPKLKRLPNAPPRYGPPRKQPPGSYNRKPPSEPPRNNPPPMAGPPARRPPPVYLPPPPVGPQARSEEDEESLPPPALPAVYEMPASMLQRRPPPLIQSSRNFPSYMRSPSEISIQKSKLTPTTVPPSTPANFYIPVLQPNPQPASSTVEPSVLYEAPKINEAPAAMLRQCLPPSQDVAMQMKVDPSASTSRTSNKDVLSHFMLREPSRNAAEFALMPQSAVPEIINVPVFELPPEAVLNDTSLSDSSHSSTTAEITTTKSTLPTPVLPTKYEFLQLKDEGEPHVEAFTSLGTSTPRPPPIGKYKSSDNPEFVLPAETINFDIQNIPEQPSEDDEDGEPDDVVSSGGQVSRTAARSLEFDSLPPLPVREDDSSRVHWNLRDSTLNPNIEPSGPQESNNDMQLNFIREMIANNTRTTRFI